MEKKLALEAMADSYAKKLQAEVAIERALHAARSYGASWAEVAAPLGMTRQAAQQKYGKGPSDLLIAADRLEDRKALDAYGTAPVELPKPSKNVDRTPKPAKIQNAPKSRVAAPGELQKWDPRTDAKPRQIDRRPTFHLDSAGFKDGVAQPGIGGRNPHACPKCGSTNHKDAYPDTIRAYNGECLPTKYDPRDIADWLTAQPRK